MSPPIWTPAALRSELRPYRRTVWRLVEAQHIVATLKLVDTLGEQAALEAVLEAAKPPLPAACAGLDYLLATPFRYRAYPKGSRFRPAGPSLGVWYGAERVETAVAEMVFYRFLFYAESPGTPLPKDPAEFTALSVPLKSAAALDLTQGALAAGRAQWMALNDYAPCQALAEAAREAGGEVIRYASVRDPKGGANVAVLTCHAFAAKAPSARQSWHIQLTPDRALALCEHPRQGLEFPRSTFTADGRLRVPRQA